MNTIEMGQLIFNIEGQDGALMVTVTGSINEDLQIDKLTHLKGASIIFDLDKVKMINSCGIREWIRLIESIGGETKLEYIKVPQIVIQQMNMISGFLSKNAKVTTFYAPYFIEDLDEEKQILLRTDEVKDFKAPKMSTNVDGTDYALDFDAIEEQYFKFLKR
jgi:hypothetical protein